MKTVVDAFTIALPVLYFWTVWAYAKAFFKDSVFAKRVKTPLLLATLVIHLAYLLMRTVLFNHPPITTIFEIMSIISFSIAAAYAVIEFQTKVKNTGYFILILAFLFQTFSSCFIENLSEVKPILRSNLLGIHVTADVVYAFAHYATAVLDHGPIIQQDVARVTHRHSVDDLVRKGRDLEKTVLAQAVRWHLEGRVLVYGNKTVVFD